MKKLWMVWVVLVAASCDNSIDAGAHAPGPADAGDSQDGGEIMPDGGETGADAAAPIACGPSSPCPEEYECIGGACALPAGSMDCDPDESMLGEDGCGPNAICHDNADDETRCYLLHACPEDGVCPVGPVGSTCNEGYMVNKNRVCLVGFCRDESSCPESWLCLRPPGETPLGWCSNKAVGSLCFGPSDCLSQRCTQVTPGLPGVCL